MNLLENLNFTYNSLHKAKEKAFWEHSVGLKNSVSGELEKCDIELKTFSTSMSMLENVRTELKQESLTSEDRLGLKGWQLFFEKNTIENDKARAFQSEIINTQISVENLINKGKIGYYPSPNGEFKTANRNELGLAVVTANLENERKAALNGLRELEKNVLKSGFLNVVKLRNKFARLLGFEDFYDYKVNLNEGFSKKKLFEILDDLELNTRKICKDLVEDSVKTHGESCREPWNFRFFNQGKSADALEPFFPFKRSLEIWAKSFAALGIKYEGAELTLDLVARNGKQDGGFMHGPSVTLFKSGIFTPARINFTSNASPGVKGSGRRELETLFHEGGHAAHFSNIKMPAPCFSQEFAPTSTAFAETQSMFLDSLVKDPAWLSRYAKSEDDQRMSEELMMEYALTNHKLESYSLRKFLIVAYFEKALYEMSDVELQPDNILAVAREIERKMIFTNGSDRPVLSVPHIVWGDASANYHGYVLAILAVDQTREFFLKRDGFLVDNPRIGPDLAQHYWREGNAKTFPEFVLKLTGQPFSAKATIAKLNKPAPILAKEIALELAAEKRIPKFEGKIELNAELNIVHGDELISSTNSGKTIEQVCSDFTAWISLLESNKASQSRSN